MYIVLKNKTKLHYAVLNIKASLQTKPVSQVLRVTSDSMYLQSFGHTIVWSYLLQNSWETWSWLTEREKKNKPILQSSTFPILCILIAKPYN